MTTLLHSLPGHKRLSVIFLLAFSVLASSTGNANSDLVAAIKYILLLDSEKGVVKISLGENHSCATFSDGELYCWGLNVTGQLGNNSKTDSNHPVPVEVNAIRTAAAVDLEERQSCALLSNNRAACWGNNIDAQLGAGGPVYLTPLEVKFPL